MSFFFQHNSPNRQGKEQAVFRENILLRIKLVSSKSVMEVVSITFDKVYLKEVTITAHVTVIIQGQENCVAFL